MHQQDSTWEQRLTEDEGLTEKQKKIILAAIESFSEKGFAATSTSEIAKKAGVAEGTIFRHYKTKKDLLLSITAPIMTKVITPFVMNDINKVLDQKFEHLEDFLKALVKNRIIFIQNNSSLIKILLQEIPFHPELRETFIEQIGTKVYARFIEIIEYYQAKGEIIDIPAAGVVRMLTSNLIGLTIAGSTMVLGMTTICSAASNSVIECASVNAVTILITGNSRRAHSTIAIRKAM